MENDLVAQQIENELLNATPRDAAVPPNLKPRVSTGKLQKPTKHRQERSIVPRIRPRKVGVNSNLRRLDGGPSRDPYDEISSPERGKGKGRRKRVVDGPFSPRRDAVRHVAPTEERRAVLGAIPDLTTRNGSRLPKRTLEHDSAEEHNSRPQISTGADGSSQALSNAVENDADGVECHDPAPHIEAAPPSDDIRRTGRMTRSSRRSNPVVLAAPKPGSGSTDRSSPQVVVPKIHVVPEKIRPQSMGYSMDEDISEAAPVEETEQRPMERPETSRPPPKRHENPPHDEHQLSEAERERSREVADPSRKRKATAPVVTTQSSKKTSKKTATRGPRTADLGQNWELFGQQSDLREAYATVELIGWKFKEGEPYTQSEVDLDDEQVISIIKLCREAKKKLTDLKSHPEDEEGDEDEDEEEEEESLFPEELQWICNGLRNLEERGEYFHDENKVNNIYFHLFGALVKLIRHAIDCYGEIDQNKAEKLSPHRSITIHHLTIITTLLKHTTSLHETLTKRYTRPQPGLCVHSPIQKIILLLRRTHQKFTHETHRHFTHLRHISSLAAHSTALALASQRHERASALAAHHATIRQKWIHLHDERRHVAPNILPLWQQLHLSVPGGDLAEQPEFDSRGDPFQRLEVFAPRIGPRRVDVEKARSVVWSLGELEALRRGMEEFAMTGGRVWTRLFRRFCKRGGVLERFNVTEIVVTGGDLRGWEEERQRRERGVVEEWVRVLEGEMWIRGRGMMMMGGEQENWR